MAIPGPVQAAVDAWLAAHDAAAPGLVEGLYLVGSVALDDWRPGSDVDVVVFLAEAASDEDADALRRAHDAARAEPGTLDVDGPRLSWADVSVPPTPLHRPWSLGADFRHDAECFEINAVTWYSLAAYGVAMRGPEPSTLSIALDVDERRSSSARTPTPTGARSPPMSTPRSPSRRARPTTPR